MAVPKTIVDAFACEIHEEQVRHCIDNLRGIDSGIIILQYSQ
jgi:hypothetical protein